MYTMDFGTCDGVHVEVVTIQGHSIQICDLCASEAADVSAFVDLALCLRFRFGIERRSRIGLMCLVGHVL